MDLKSKSKKILLSSVAASLLTTSSFAAMELDVEQLNMTSSQLQWQELDQTGAIVESDDNETITIDGSTGEITVNTDEAKIKYLGTVTDKTAFNTTYGTDFNTSVEIYQIALIQNNEQIDYSGTDSTGHSSLETLIADIHFMFENGLKFSDYDTTNSIGNILDDTGSTAGTYTITTMTDGNRAIKVSITASTDSWQPAFVESNGAVYWGDWSSPNSGATGYLFNAAGRDQFITLVNGGTVTTEISFWDDIKDYTTDYAALTAVDPTPFIGATPLYNLELEMYDEGNMQGGGSVKVAEFDVDNDAAYSLGDEIYIQFDTNITTLTTANISAIDETTTVSLGTDFTVTAVTAGTTLTDMPDFAAATEGTGTANTFKITLGANPTVQTGSSVVVKNSSDVTIANFPLLAVVNADDIIAELANIQTMLNEAADIPPEMKTAIETLLAQAQTIVDTIDPNTGITDTQEADLIAIISEIHQMKDMMGDDDAKMYGADASILSGTVTLPSGVTLTSPENCFDTTTQMPLPECNAVFIDLQTKDGEWLGSTMVEADGTYNLYFRELADSETIDATVQVHIHLDGVEEHYYYDLGDDNAPLGSSTAADSFKSHMEVQWNPVDENSDGVTDTWPDGGEKWAPDVNHINISTSETTLDLNIANMDADKYLVSGTVTVPSDFIPGEIIGTNGEWLGWQMVNIIAINKDTGVEYRTEIGRTETTSGNSTYPFKIKLPQPTTEDHYIVRIEKFSDKAGASEWVEMYLDDESGVATVSSDHTADNDEALVSANGVMWEETSQDSGIWLPDTDKTGYFTITSGEANIEDYNIDISNYGANFKKISGSVTPPDGFDLSDYNNHMHIDVLDAATGWWIAGSPVNCDTDGLNCTYSVTLGDTVNTAGYIIRVNQDHWDETNWENSWWKGLFRDFGADNAVGGDDDSFKDEMDVRWNESIDSTTGEYYWVPDVNPLILTDSTTLNISFSNYVAPTTYSISGTISGIDANAQWANINLFNPQTYSGTGAEIKSDGTFNIQNIKEGNYIMEINYDVANGEYKHYHYIVTDDDGDFTSGTEVVDGMDVNWKPFASDGTAIDEVDTWSENFDWSTVAYWAPKIQNGTAKINVSSTTGDIAMGTLAITQPTFYNLTTTLSGINNSTNVNFNLFVPNEPIGRWENNSSASDGTTTSVVLRDLKERTDYQLQVWIDGLGEFWYNADPDGNGDTSDAKLDSDVIWVGIQDGTVCDNWKTETWTCDWSQPVTWKPNIDGFTVDATATLPLTIPNDRAKITATLALGADYADQMIHINMWQHNGSNYAWEEYMSDGSGNVAVAMSVKQATNYRMEAYIPDTWEGFVVDLGATSGTPPRGEIDGSDDSLITNQNSWSNTAPWGPKGSTLFDAEASDLTSGTLELGTLTPPTLNTLTFTINNLDDNDSNTSNGVTEQMFIDLEAIDGSNNPIGEWYGMDNADWSDWQNPTFSNSVSVKVPTGDYRVMIHPQNHKGGIITNGDGNANDTIAADATVSSFTWDWSKADKISVSGTQAYTITLPAAADMKSISGTVSGVTGGDMSGWIHAWSPTVDGNGAEVASDGTFTIKGLTAADDYTIEYWSWTQPDMIKQALGVWDSVDEITSSSTNENITDVSVAKSATIHTFAGILTNLSAGSNTFSILLIDFIDADNWEVIEEAEAGTLDNAGTYDYTFNVPPALASHKYIVAVGMKTVDTATGAVEYSLYEAAEDTSSNTPTTGDSTEVTATGIDNNTNSVTLTVVETTNE
ncbi:MAG: hypothetical protein U9Q33_03240 [Campylobacterota bacterium]|nr:hypothetical protein [Campylobacterota bacterium]